ncbi:MAG: nucleoside-diphosphate kinase [Candidatus Marsarchaeota archaeon]|nr:nucleoside-diphosphate kinase [Candidatus Marsarchaeota archaeon]MCL5094774.1 nucleoside-diphosphate kinase [Candidatus Marsarchaeota archaeon]
MMEKTLVLVKPDGVSRALIGTIIAKFENAGLKIVGLKIVKIDKEFAARHYIEDREWLENIGAKSKAAYKEKGIELKEQNIEIGERVRNQLLDYLTEGPVVAMVIEGNSAIYVVRKLIGATEPRKADSASIRGQYSSDSYDLADEKQRSTKNLVHASEDSKTAEREINLWFNKKEIIEYKRIDEDSIY